MTTLDAVRTALANGNLDEAELLIADLDKSDLRILLAELPPGHPLIELIEQLLAEIEREKYPADK